MVVLVVVVVVENNITASYMKKMKERSEKESSVLDGHLTSHWTSIPNYRAENDEKQNSKAKTLLVIFDVAA